MIEDPHYRPDGRLQRRFSADQLSAAMYRLARSDDTLRWEDYISGRSPEEPTPEEIMYELSAATWQQAVEIVGLRYVAPAFLQYVRPDGKGLAMDDELSKLHPALLHHAQKAWSEVEFNKDLFFSRFDRAPDIATGHSELDQEIDL